MRQEVKDYLDSILNHGLEKDYWFMTKQTMTDYYFIFTQAKVVETFNAKRNSNENFGAYYARFFRENEELNAKYPAQGASENTYRNAISAESLGFFYRETDKYDSGVVTPAYQVLARYVNNYNDSLKYRFLFERQIEKLCLNVNPKLGNYTDLQGVRNFPVMFLYKILLELQKRTGDSTLKYEEFVVFLFRTKNYSEWESALNLILWYREEGLDAEYREKFNQIFKDITAENIRFDTLIGNLSNIVYTDKKHGNYYKIKDSYESLRYIENSVEIFEASSYVNENNPETLLSFLRSDKYFIGNLDTAFRIVEVPDETADSELSDLEKMILEHWNSKDFDYKEIDEPLADFKAMFGKDAIKNMADDECLLKLFGKKEELSLVYYLEHVEKYWYFGRISNYRHNYILYEKDGSWRYATSAKTITKINVDDAIEYAKQFRDMFVSLFEKIETYIADDSLRTIEGYETLYSEAKTILGVFYNKNWVWKYIFMLYPEFFVPFYSNEWVSKMFRVAKLVPGNNYVVQCGQFTIFSRKLGINPIYVYKILCLIDDSEIEEEDEGAEEMEDVSLASKYDNCERLKVGTNIILYGVPGAGKSWTIKNEYCDSNTIMERVVFHPDYTYSDFVGQILPKSKDGDVSYEFVPGPFTKIVRDAYRNPMAKFILVIEEINRGNAPAIFGDIFQLLDRNSETLDSDYEITNADIARIVYEDDDHMVKIPSNMMIICTMNTSDQNVFTLDTAFQRRWNMRLIENSFRKETDEEKFFAEHKILDTTISWEQFVEAINKEILDKNKNMTSSEDKRLGTHFVSLSDLEYDEKENDESVDSSVRREAKLKNRRFPEKVIKYLWDDAFKFYRDEIFRENLDSLEKVIKLFVDSRGNDRFNVFKENIKNAIEKVA